MKVSKIKTNPNNPRIIKDERFAKLVQSIKDFPKMMELRPMVINSDNIVLGGNMRLKAITELGMKEIPDSWVKKATDLTEEEARRFIIADNVGFGEHDWEVLANEWNMDELTDWGLEIPDFVNKPEATEDDYTIPDTIETDIVKGDLFELTANGITHRMLCGDSTNADDVAKLMNGEKADMVFTDPPYGVDYQGGALTKRTKLDNDQKNTNIYQDVLPNIYLFTIEKAAMYIWHAAGYADMASHLWDNDIEIRSQIIWNKNMAQFGALSAQYKQKHEPCFYCYKKGQSPNWYGPTNEVTVWDVKRESKNEYHPTQKPIELPERAMNNSSKKNDIILDFFGGSGSTMVAAQQLNRKARLMELDPKYCQVIVDRMRKLDPTLVIKKNGLPL